MQSLVLQLCSSISSKLCRRAFFISSGLSRRVGTFSSLGADFNSIPAPKRQQVSSSHGLFQIPELYDHNGFSVLVEHARTEAADLVREASSSSRNRKLVSVFDQLSDCLCRVADMSDFVRVAHPDQLYARAAENACSNISSLVETLNTNTDIYQALKNVLLDGDCVPMDDVDRRVAELFLFDFEQSGIHLPEHDRRRFVELSEDILALGSSFMQGCQRAVYVPRDELDARVRDVFTRTGNNIMVTGMFADNPSDAVREAAYRIYLYADSRQTGVLESLLAARFELAHLAGFKTYAHRSLSGTMAGSPERVVEFLEALAESIRSRTDAEVKILRDVKRRHGGTSEIFQWDTNYYAGVARHEMCTVSSAQMAPYFSLGACIEGLSGIFTDLFGISLQRVEAKCGELWAPDIQKLQVVHETEGELGTIYCDLFERPHKPHHDCHFTVRGGRLLDDGTYQHPVVVLLLNLPPPRGTTPSLLGLGAVENLFHEFGHAMHSMLGRTRYQHVTGTRCPTDFAEVPSVLMEYFAADIRVLSRFARHWKTGQPVPRESLECLLRSRRLFAASEMQQQVFYSLVDQAYHGRYPTPESTILTVAAELQNKYCSLGPVPGTAWQLRFGHLVGYGARYYSYLMSRAVAARVWHECFRSDPFSRAAGERYRESLLAHGGQVPPAKLVQDVLNEPPSTAMLVRALLDDLDNN